MRKILLKPRVFGFILLGLLVGCGPSEVLPESTYIFDGGSTLEIAIATDIHYLSASINDYGQAFDTFVASGDGKQLTNITAIMAAFVDDLKTSRPDLLIISGDLTTNGAKQSHLDLIDYLEVIEDQGTHVYVIPGNHDINNPWARGFSGDQQTATATIDDKDFRQMYGDFGFDEALLKDEETLSYLVTPSEDLWFLMLDTNRYSKNKSLGYPQADGEINLSTQAWIETCLALAAEKGATLVPVMHHNLLTHSEVIQAGYTLNNNEEVMALFMPHVNNLVLSGHIHIQDIASESRDGRTIYEIVTNALSVYPHQVGRLTYEPGEGEFTYQSAKVDVGGWAAKTGVEDANLVQFGRYAESYFEGFAYSLAYNRLIQDDTYSLDEIESMSEIIQTLNLRYFSGTEHLNASDLIHSRGYQLLAGSNLGFLKNYALSIVEDQDQADNYLNFHINGQE